jgi:hypothetical protein
MKVKGLTINEFTKFLLFFFLLSSVYHCKLYSQNNEVITVQEEEGDNNSGFQLNFDKYRESVNFEVGISFENAFVYTATVSYTRFLNPFVGLSVGLQGMKTNIEAYWSKYSIEKNIFKLNGLISLSLYSPRINKLGFFADASFIFEALPFAFPTITENESGKIHNKTVFTKFNPSYFLSAGIYFKLKPGMILLGINNSMYDTYVGYRNVEIQGESIASHIPGKSMLWGLGLKLIIPID